MTEKILFDTDIGSDIDDSVCLAYLLGHPQAELLGITTVSGQPIRRAMMASAQCKVAGKNIPIYPGAENPLIVDIVQAKAQQAEALNRWPHDTEFPVGEAVEFMRRTIRQHPGEVTLLAVGPLTNVGLLFAVDPEIPSLLKQVVLMNGWFLGDRRPAEWNTKLDPHASEIVYRAKTPRLRTVGIDVTAQVVMPADEVRQRFDRPLLRPVLDFAEVWFRERDHITFHDPLAAVCIFNDSVCQFERGHISVELNDPDHLGRTNWQADISGQHEVGTSVNATKFFDNFFSVL